MANKKKLLEKIRRNIRNVSLEDFESLISMYGYIETRGKHPKAIMDKYTMPYKKENLVKSCYVKELITIIDSL